MDWAVMGRTGSVRLGVVVALLLPLGVPAFAVDVALDPTFSGNGKVIVADRNSGTSALARHGDSTYAAGSRSLGDKHWLFVTKLDANGDLDPSFSQDGVRYLPMEAEDYPLAGLTVDENGLPLVAAQSRKHLVVLRLTTDGALDTNFSANGMRRFRDPGSALFFDPDIVVDSHNRVVVGDMIDTKQGLDVHIRRFLPDGTLDDSWSGDGLKVVDNGDVDWMEGLVVDGGDRVILGSDLGGKSPALVYRFRRNGAADASFSDDGVAHFRFAPRADTYPIGIGVADSGKITVAAASLNQVAYGTARLLENGTLDATYGDHGILGLSCMQCSPLWADVARGRVAIVTDPYHQSGHTRMVRIGAAGESVVHQSIDIFGNSSGYVQPVEIVGSKTLVGGELHNRGFVARLE